MNRVNGDTSGITSSPSSGTFTPELKNKGSAGADILVKSAQELQEEQSLISVWPGAAGATALRQVQFLASSASENTDAMDESQFSLATRRQNRIQTYIPKQKSDSEATNGSSLVSNTKNIFRRRRERKERQRLKQLKNSVDPVGEGGGVFNNAEFNTVAKKAEISKLKRSDLEVSSSDKREEQVWTALANLELDSEYKTMNHVNSSGFCGFSNMIT
jgi:hypothetical protein